MTVSTEVNQAAYTGNGVTTVFPYTFRILNSSNLTVTRVDLLGVEAVLTLGTDYIVTGAGSYNGGAVTLSQALPSGYSLVIVRDLAIVQETDLRNQGTFFAEVHEDAFDYLTMIIQQVAGWFGLALRRPTIKSNFYNALQYRISNLADPVNDQDAVNTRSMRSYVEKMIAGVVGGFGWFIQAGAGAVYRTFQDKMRDALSAYDFGARSDDSINNTSVFSLLETDTKHNYISLNGKEFLVNEKPRQNYYGYGFFNVPDSMQYTGSPFSYIRKDVPFHTPNFNAAPSLNLYRDANVNSLRLMRVTEKNSDGDNRIFQDIVFDENNRKMYALTRDTTSTMSNVVVYNMDNLGLDATAVGASAFTTTLHGSGLSLQYTESGTPWLWGSGRIESGRADGNAYVVRFQYSGVNGEAITNITRYKVLTPDVNQYDGNETTPEVSRCGRYMAVIGRIDTKRMVIRVFEMSIFNNAADGADFSNKYLHQWEVDMRLIADNSVNEPQPKQGMCCDGTYIYIIAGSSRKTTGKHIHVYTLDGKFVCQHNNIDAESAASNAFNEPQGLTTLALGSDRQSFSLVTNVVGNNSSFPGYKASTVIAIANTPALLRNGTNNGIGTQMPQCRWHVSNTAYPTAIVSPPGGLLGCYQNSGTTSFLGILGLSTLGFTHELMMGHAESPRSGRVSYTSDVDGSYQISFWANSVKMFSGNIASDGQFSLLRSGPTGNMGTSSTPWGTAYFQVSPVIVSDREYKEQITELSILEKNAAKKCKSLVRKFKLKESVVEKGDGARWHVGVIAQDVAEAFREQGLDPFEYGIVCYDEWPEQLEVEEVAEVMSEDGASVLVPGVAYRPYRAAGSKYQIRYDELMCFIISAI